MHRREDLLLFLAVLAAGVVLVAVAHMPADGLAALYAAWKGHGGKRN
ncbi:hypothetical protein ACPCVO_49145 [Streptomyces umbrinus]